MKPIYLIAFILMSFRTFANQTLIYSENKGNIHIEYVSGWGQLEIGNKISIFLELSDKLIKDKFANSEQLYIYFGHDYSESDSSYYAVGYGQFTYLDFGKNKPSKEIKTKGIKIIIIDNDFDIKKMLLLVNAAFSDVSFIKRNQFENIINTRYYKVDTLNSIRPYLVEKYLSSSDPAIDKLLNEKTYRYLKQPKEDWDIDYYYQNNQFHFYNTREPEKMWSKSKRKYVVSKTFGERILTVDNIYEIIGRIYDGHFVFINASTFYYISQLKDKVRGPYKIDSIVAGRRVRQYYHENGHIEKFTLLIDNYINTSKVLFIPDSNLLVSNYDKVENNFINGLLNKTDAKKITSNSNRIVNILLIVLGLCFALIIWLRTLQCKNKPIP